MVADFGVLVQLLRTQGLGLARKLVVERVTKDWPTLMATPLIGPVFGWIVGRVVVWVVRTLSDEVEFIAFIANTYVRVQAEARALESAVDQKDRAQTSAELLEAERVEIKATDDLVKFNR